MVPLDLADLGSVREAAEAVAGIVDRLDVLVNNAGVMALPLRRTVDGFELQFATNHLGVGSLTAARDDQAARRLWELSEDLTGVTYAWSPPVWRTASREPGARAAGDAPRTRARRRPT